ncbi:MAG TPA: MBL fold metallo-hydrolase [Casimicrobiaceae bacterium]|nr:MBL fold metallo-hydrolase [Casimicrobiaceae bacterium]
MVTLPPQVQVIVRDWLSANHVLLQDRDEIVLIDTGYASRSTLTLALLKSALRDRPITSIVNTHCHSDHMGGNAAIAREYGCDIAIPEGEVPLIEAWDERALLLGYCDQAAGRFTPDRALRDGEINRWGGLEWLATATPGHDMGAMCFYNAKHRVLLSGDALWANGFGFVMPPAIDPVALPATRATLQALAKLPIDIVIPGHGEPFGDVGSAFERAFRRLESFEADPSRLPRYAVKAVFAFTLLDRGSFLVDELPAYIEHIDMYREFNERFFGLSPTAFAGWIIEELGRAGAIRREGSRIVPSVATAG